MKMLVGGSSQLMKRQMRAQMLRILNRKVKWGIICLILMEMMLHACNHLNAPITYVTEITVEHSNLLSWRSRGSGA
jgi:hypothetical protein